MLSSASLLRFLAISENQFCCRFIEPILLAETEVGISEGNHGKWLCMSMAY
jgi:hypothetical protein